MTKGPNPAGGASRRSLLLGAAGVTGVAVAGGAWPDGIAGAAAAPEAGGGRTYTSGRFALSLEGAACGPVAGFEGGEIEAAVVTLPMAHDYYTKKHLGNVKYNEFALELGLSMGEPVRKWIEASLEANHLRKSGELQAADFDYRVERVRAFTGAVITEVGFPACDGASKDPAYLSLKFAPELTRNRKGSGKVENPVDVRQKAWLPANFRFTIDGLERACAKVSKIDALVVKQAVPASADGTPRQLEPAKLEFPNLRITLPDSAAQPFYDWHEDFVVNGNDDDTHERGGSLVYLDSDLRTPLLTLTFHNIGIFKGAGEAAENNADKIRRVTFELYVERVVARFAG